MITVQLMFGSIYFDNHISMKSISKIEIGISSEFYKSQHENGHFYFLTTHHYYQPCLQSIYYREMTEEMPFQWRLEPANGACLYADAFEAIR